MNGDTRELLLKIAKQRGADGVALFVFLPGGHVELHIGNGALGLSPNDEQIEKLQAFGRDLSRCT